MVAVTLLDGTTINLPARRSRAAPSDQPAADEFGVALSEDERIQQAIDSTGCTDPTDLSFGTPVGSAGDACYLVSSPNEAERSFSLAPTSGDYASFTLYYVDPATGEATSTYTGETPYECIVQGFISCDTYAYLPLNGSIGLTEGTYVLSITGGHTFRLQG